MATWEYAQVEVTGPHVTWKAKGLWASMTADWSSVRPDGDSEKRMRWKIVFRNSGGPQSVLERELVNELELLNWYGQRRWELVHVSSGVFDGKTTPPTKIKSRTYMLKRPVQSAARRPAQ